MSYLTNIPFTGETLGQSRTQVQGNFSIINTGIGVDHIDLQTSGSGKHNKSTYVVQTSPTDPVTGANEVAVYSKLNGSGDPNLYQRLQNSGAIIPFTPLLTTSNIMIDGTAFNQYSITIGGARFTWGSATRPAGFATNTTVPFAIAFTGAPSSIQLTVEDPNVAVVLLNVATAPISSAFSIKNNAAISFTYLAIGLA